MLLQLDSLWAATETLEKRLSEKVSPAQAFSDAVKVSCVGAMFSV